MYINPLAADALARLPPEERNFLIKKEKTRKAEAEATQEVMCFGMYLIIVFMLYGLFVLLESEGKLLNNEYVYMAGSLALVFCLAGLGNAIKKYYKPIKV